MRAASLRRRAFYRNESRRAMRRMAANASPTHTHGSHTQTNSEVSTAAPRAENIAATPIGETSITLNGAKKRSADQGHRNAMPRPPLVKLSRSEERRVGKE